jgi:hypothetical protein
VSHKAVDIRMEKRFSTRERYYGGPEVDETIDSFMQGLCRNGARSGVVLIAVGTTKVAPTRDDDLCKEGVFVVNESP